MKAAFKKGCILNVTLYMILTLEQAKKIKQDHSFINNIDGEYLVLSPYDDQANKFIKYAYELIYKDIEYDDPIWKSKNGKYTLFVITIIRVNMYGYQQLDEWLSSQQKQFNYEKYGVERP